MIRKGEIGRLQVRENRTTSTRNKGKGQIGAPAGNKIPCVNYPIGIHGIP